MPVVFSVNVVWAAPPTPPEGVNVKPAPPLSGVNATPFVLVKMS